MRRIRVIPVLLIDKRRLVKTVRFTDPVYIGDPINAVKIFNEKEVDEIIILDISATRNSTEPDFELLSDLANEAFMPFAYGGGIKTIEHVRRLISMGIEKVILNSSVYENKSLISSIASEFGSQSVVVSIDVKKNWLGKLRAYSHNGRKEIKSEISELLSSVQQNGCGEIMLQNIDRDGTYKGYSLDVIKQLSPLINVPWISCSGASSVNDFEKAISAGASAVAAGSLFVYYGPQKGVLINYPDQASLKKELYEKF